MDSRPSPTVPWSPLTSPLLPPPVLTTSPPREPLLDHLAQLHLPWNNSTTLLEEQVLSPSTTLKVLLERKYSITLLDPLEHRPSTRLLARLVTSPSTTLKVLLELKHSTMLLDLLEPSPTTMVKVLQELWSLSTTTPDLLDLVWSLSITTLDLLDLVWSLSITTPDLLDLAWSLSITTLDLLDLVWSLFITTPDLMDLEWSLSITPPDLLDPAWSLSITPAHILLLLHMRMMDSAMLDPSTSTPSWLPTPTAPWSLLMSPLLPPPVPTTWLPRVMLTTTSMVLDQLSMDSSSSQMASIFKWRT